MAQSVNNSSGTNSYSQKTDSPLFASTSQIPASLSAMLSQPIHLSSNQSQTRLVDNGKTNSNGQPNLSNNQPMLGNGAIRFQEPHPFQKGKKFDQIDYSHDNHVHCFSIFAEFNSFSIKYEFGHDIYCIVCPDYRSFKDSTRAITN